MKTYGKAPFLECSSHGDKRFSAFYAHVNGRSIEEQYQAAKVFADGSTGLQACKCCRMCRSVRKTMAAVYF